MRARDRGRTNQPRVDVLSYAGKRDGHGQPGFFLQRPGKGLKKQMSIEVTSEACMQAFGASTSEKGLRTEPLEALRFSAGF